MPRPPLRPELEALRDLRLARDWSWRQLGDHLHDCGVNVSPHTLQRLMADPSRQPNERTLYKLQRFLKNIQQTDGANA